MAVLTGEQIAQLAYQVGFRGETLVQVVAIAKRESGYNPAAFNGDRATGDQSYGLMQINMLGDMGPSRLRMFGISSAEQLFDPLINMRAAYRLYQASGNSLQPWGGYKGMSNTYNTDLSAAGRAVQNAANQGLLGTDWAGSMQTYGSYMTGSAQSFAGSTFQSGPVQLPSDTQIVNVGYNIYAVYDLGGVKLAYTVDTAPGAVDWKSKSGGIQALTQDQFNQQGYILAGDARELGTVTGTFTNFKSFWDSVLSRVMGPYNPARNDPEVQRVMAEFAARPDMDPVELQNKLQSTQWFQTHTTSELEWNGLAASEQDKRRQEAGVRAADTWFQYVGERIDPGDPRVANYIEQLASGQMGWGAFSQIIKDQARQLGESPYSRELRSEQEAQRQRGIDTENTAQNIRETLRRWGLQWTDSMIMDWSKRIVEKVSSDDDLTQAIQQQAAVLYPWKDPQLETLQAAQPWLQVFERRMEKVGSLMDPQVQKALTAGQTPWDFEQELKRSPAWLTTRNAREEMYETGFEVGKRMGFV